MSAIALKTLHVVQLPEVLIRVSEGERKASASIHADGTIDIERKNLEGTQTARYIFERHGRDGILLSEYHINYPHTTPPITKTTHQVELKGEKIIKADWVHNGINKNFVPGHAVRFGGDDGASGRITDFYTQNLIAAVMAKQVIKANLTALGRRGDETSLAAKEVLKSALAGLEKGLASMGHKAANHRAK